MRKYKKKLIKYKKKLIKYKNIDINPILHNWIKNHRTQWVILGLILFVLETLWLQHIISYFKGVQVSFILCSIIVIASDYIPKNLRIFFILVMISAQIIIWLTKL